MIFPQRMRAVVKTLAVVTALAVPLMLAVTSSVEARSSGSFGSRGSRTFQAPPTTRTAPNAAQPMQRTITQPSAAAPAAGAAAKGGFLNRPGLLGGLAAGFLGAGLLGMLFGGGFLAGMGSFASILGLILQVVLVIFVARLAFNWWQRRNNPAPAYGAANGQQPTNQNNAAFTGLGAGTGGAAGAGGAFGGMFGGGAKAAPVTQPITIGEEDFNEFERLLSEIQAAYSAEDLNALRANAMPEMVSYFAEEIDENAKQGVVNRVTDVKLLQGDLAEAWRENNDEYATVAMRFAVTDSVVQRSTGQVVEGGTPGEATELWTFRRSRGAPWMLSAIQQG